ncbi:uncharacterized protein LOC131325457 [Rhododendron vialii]|uniref:uncharacterized protein LOC131325457 n=1 Tax=Rhododendron vialii TaxID=182163 RepID=UPI00266013D6|nr:uncharacterized protein LOC131325457 [Rhododendron vialii]
MKSSTPSRRCSLSRRRLGTLFLRNKIIVVLASVLLLYSRIVSRSRTPYHPPQLLTKIISRHQRSTERRGKVGSMVGEGGQKRRRRIEGTNLDCQILICFSWYILLSLYATALFGVNYTADWKYVDHDSAILLSFHAIK